MQQHPTHSLLPKQRLQIYKSLGSWEYKKVVKTWGCLAYLSVEYVIPILKKEALSSNNVEEFTNNFLKLIKSLLDESEDQETIFTNYEYYLYAKFSYLEIRGAVAANWVLSTLEQAFALAWGSKPFSGLNMVLIEAGIPDEQCWGLGDGANGAVLAYSGFDASYEFRGFEDKLDDTAGRKYYPASSDFSPAKRLEFWTWWLTEAIPQAWELGQAY